MIKKTISTIWKSIVASQYILFNLGLSKKHKIVETINLLIRSFTAWVNNKSTTLRQTFCYLLTRILYNKKCFTWILKLLVFLCRGIIIFWQGELDSLGTGGPQLGAWLPQDGGTHWSSAITRTISHIRRTILIKITLLMIRE